ncbi:MAG: glycosyltransferase [Candidatus Kapabacteria bacterium]|nr:glycosyltransferase [Candidatus Kapabacteria bacterium]
MTLNIELIFIFAFVFYGLRCILFIIGSYLERIKSKKSFNSTFLPKVSIIVPARNEEKNIKNCIESIALSNYPKENFEIVVVNDRSEDSTGAILKELSINIPNLVVLEIKNASEKNLQGKPGALDAGIKLSKHDIILMTDADCTVHKNWIATMASHYADEKVGLVASYTLIKHRTAFHFMQAIEWIYMHTMGAAGMGINFPLGCYGNNYSVRKSDYFALGGYENIKFSLTEDLALVIAIFKLGKKVHYVVNENSSVHTLPCDNFGEYIRQHHRWATGGKGLGWFAILFVLVAFSLMSALVAALITQNYSMFFCLLGFRVIMDSIVSFPAIISFKQWKLLPWLIPSVPFFIFVEFIVPFLIINPKVKWKGQIFTTK